MSINIIPPSATLYPELDVSPAEHVARCARVCYGREGLTEHADTLVDGLIKNGHRSMLRHESVYLRCKSSAIFDDHDLDPAYITVRTSHNENEQLQAYFATNGQYYYEHRAIFDAYGFVRISARYFLRACIADYNRRHRMASPDRLLFQAFRFTLCLTTQISTSRELNRTSPNNIAERSTRYCAVRGDLDICAPWWWDEARAARDEALRRRMEVARWTWLACAYNYRNLTTCGMRPEDARGLLPLDTATRVIYTYPLWKWRQIFDLRLRGTTGRPHPNARLAAALMQGEIINFLKAYRVDLEV